MDLGEKLIELRKDKKLSQEEVADKLNVTRQTVSKWETNQSTPDFDKIVPLCNLYSITPDELLIGVTKEESSISNIEESKLNKRKRVNGLTIGVLLYFIAVAWIMVSIPVFSLHPVLSAAIFLLICGVATAIIVYTAIMYKDKKEKAKEEKESKLYKQLEGIISLIVLIIYLGVSFVTFAWHITWIIWIIYALIMEIVKLILSLRGEEYEE